MADQENPYNAHAHENNYIESGGLNSNYRKLNRATSFAQPGILQDLGETRQKTTNAATTFSFSPGTSTDISLERLWVGEVG